MGYEHCEHEKFLVKENVKSEWLPATDRELIYIRSAEDHIGLAQELTAANNPTASAEYKLSLINKFTQQMANNILKGKIQDWTIDRVTSIERFFLSCFSGYGNDMQQEKKSNKLDLAIFGRDFKKYCIICKKDKGDAKKLKKMDCGHAIDEDCLMELYKIRQFCCPEDGSDIIKGFVKVYFPNAKAQIPKLTINETKKEQKLPVISTKPSFSKDNKIMRGKTVASNISKTIDFGFECSGKKLSSMNINDGIRSFSPKQPQIVKEIYITPEIANYNQETGLEIVYEEENSNYVDKQISSISKSSIRGCNPYQLFNGTSSSIQNYGKKVSDTSGLQNRAMIKTSKKIRLLSNIKEKEKDKSLNFQSHQIHDIVLVGNTFTNIGPKGRNNSLKYNSNKVSLNSELPEIITVRELDT